MTELEKFIAWATDHGADVEVVQEDDGSGFTCINLVTMHYVFDLTVNEVPGP